MARFKFDPLTKELINTDPRGVEIPESAFAYNEPPILYTRPKTTSPLLVAIMITLIIILILALAYLFWVWFVKEDDQSSLSIFDWLRNLVN